MVFVLTQDKKKRSSNCSELINLPAELGTLDSLKCEYGEKDRTFSGFVLLFQFISRRLRFTMEFLSALKTHHSLRFSLPLFHSSPRASISVNPRKSLSLSSYSSNSASHCVHHCQLQFYIQHTTLGFIYIQILSL